MSLPVNVSSAEVITNFRATLCRVAEDSKNGLAAAEMEINRMVDWLTNDRRLYWQAEIKRRRELVERARVELSRKQTGRMFGNDASMAEPREILRKARARLEMAEQKLERVRQWVQPLQQAIMDYRAAARPLSDMIDGDAERAMALLDNMARALEEYASGHAPPAPTPAGVAPSGPPGQGSLSS